MNYETANQNQWLESSIQEITALFKDAIPSVSSLPFVTAYRRRRAQKRCERNCATLLKISEHVGDDWTARFTKLDAMSQDRRVAEITMIVEDDYPDLVECREGLDGLVKTIRFQQRRSHSNLDSMLESTEASLCKFKSVCDRILEYNAKVCQEVAAGQFDGMDLIATPASNSDESIRSEAWNKS